MKAAKRRELAVWDAGALQDQRAAVVPAVSDATVVWYAKSQARDQSGLRCGFEIAMSRPRFGYPRVLVMLKRESWVVGKKRVYRLYRLEGPSLRMKTKRSKRVSLLRRKAVPATGPNLPV